MTKLSKLSRSVEGKVALITGAGSGMGRATAHLFADEGVYVAVTDVDAQAVDQVVAEITGAGLQATGWQLDVANAEQIDSVVAAVVAHYGKLDWLINNAGVAQRTSLEDSDYLSNWQRCHDVNLTGQMLLIRSAMPHLKNSEGGRIVNIASTEGLGATKGNSAYSTSKHGVIGLTRSLATDFGKAGLTINCICPGPIRSNMTAAIPEEQKEIFARRRTSVGRYGEPEEVAHGTLNFCLPSSSYMNGAVLAVDGGHSIRNA